MSSEDLPEIKQSDLDKILAEYIEENGELPTTNIDGDPLPYPIYIEKYWGASNIDNRKLGIVESYTHLSRCSQEERKYYSYIDNSDDEEEENDPFLIRYYFSYVPK